MPKARERKGQKVAPPANKKSRYQDLQARYKTEPSMPDISGFEYLLAWSNELGLSKIGGMSQAPKDWVDIESWARMTRTDADPWECTTLVKMSEAYVAMCGKATDPDCPPPHQMDMSGIDRNAVSDQIKAALLSRTKE